MSDEGWSAATATVEDGVSLGPGTKVWDLAHVRRGARIGADCVIGRGALIDVDVVMGDRCKVQSGALVYSPAVLGDGVFVGPAAIITNDRHPRAVLPDGAVASRSDWKPAAVSVGDGASLGAGSVVVAGVTIGSWALVGAGAVVHRDVPAFALVTGVPAVRSGWVGRTGRRLVDAGRGEWHCPDTGDHYIESNGGLRVIG